MGVLGQNLESFLVLIARRRACSCFILLVVSLMHNSAKLIALSPVQWKFDHNENGFVTISIMTKLLRLGTVSFRYNEGRPHNYNSLVSLDDT